MDLLSSSTSRRGLVFLAAGAVASGLLVTAPHTAGAATPCRMSTTVNLDNQQGFAGGSTLQRYTATAQGEPVGAYNQRAKLLLAKYPAGAFPALVNPNIGNVVKTADLVKNQRRQALAAINGDFFSFPTIKGKDMTVPRGPMVRDGRVIRGTYQRQRVVGVTQSLHPFGGLMAVRGNLIPQLAGTQSVHVRGVNWQKVMKGGVTMYTPEWNASTSTPRPSGVAEWVLNGRNKIIEVRTNTKNSAARGNPVANGTRVMAFSENTAGLALIPSGTQVNVNIRQSTSTGTKLRTAIGRGVPLVEAGVPAPLGCGAYAHSEAARPRTVIGWTANGAWRSITVPGTKFDGIGLRVGGFGLANEANLAHRLGLEYAYEIDGGGSTTLYTRSSAGGFTRRDLYKVDTSVCACERPVTNAIAFMK